MRHKWVLYRVAKATIEFKWFLLGDYYFRLAVQARYLYRQSSLFKDRWQYIGLDYAENSFEDVADHFFWKAKKEHLLIRGRILLDSILGRPVQPYAIKDDSIV